MSYKYSSLLDVTVLIDTFSCFHVPSFLLENFMKPLHRSSVSKSASSAQFRGNVGRTKGANIMAAPMRGGIRL